MQDLKYLKDIPEDALLSEIFVYSQRDAYMGKPSEEEHRVGVLGIDEGRRAHGAISFHSPQSAHRVKLALLPKTQYEPLQVTMLRATIVETIEQKGLFFSAVRTRKEANERGIVLIDDLMDMTLPLGVLANDG